VAGMSATLARWNRLHPEEAAREIFPCCGSTAWAGGMAARRPFPDEAALLAAADETWRNLAGADWREAFRGHPRIGESQASSSRALSSAAWSKQEQQDVGSAEDAVKIELGRGNQEYERRFGQIFIVCATGKSGPEILEMLRHRLQNDPETELRETAEQQRQITRIRLKKWLSQ
jgi:2-oxo-4-hydroxy-4-carboxy-5-ureidoimidazoline decarboxylase